jgi:pyruvate dehydrogenase E2 component (dihydrolipoamide acetyltransferase)
MATKVTLPQFGNTMEEGTIVTCLVKVGDKVGRGDVLFEIETDKATIEMESPADGYVKAILVEVGQTIPVHEPVLILGTKDEQVPHDYISTAKPAPAAERVESIAVPAPGTPATSAETAAAAAGAAPVEYRLGQVVPLSRLQKITAQRMLQSKQQIPCFYLTVRVDVTELVTRREQINRSGDANVSYNDFIIRAAAMGLQHFAIMTGQVEGETIKLADSIDIGLAMSVPGGLVAPTVKDANRKSLLQIAHDTQELIERARSNKLAPDDLSGGCTTISNLGSFGIESFIAVPLPGQCSILGVGEIIDTPVPDNGKVVIRKLMSITVSVDHRVANGSYAGQFLDYVRKLLQDPAALD